MTLNKQDSTTLIKPKEATIVQRAVSNKIKNLALQLNLTNLQATIVAGRLSEEQVTQENTDANLELLDKIINPKLAHLQHPNLLKNSTQAASIIADAIESNGKIVLATDYDTDGVTSAWIANRALVSYFNVAKERLVQVLGNRKIGYGITDEVVDRILAIDDPIDLVISADQGSSDEPRIKKLKDNNIAVCVTDHHQIPVEGTPKSAVCTVNPQQDGCEYDNCVAGCFVIFLVMTQVRIELINRGYLNENSPRLKELTSSVALGTVADSVSLKSINNRAIIKAGLNVINKFEDVSWQAIHALNSNNEQPINAEYLGFQVATRINAASRVSDVMTAFDFLNADSFHDAQNHLDQLNLDNLNRREQQSSMLEQAKIFAKNIFYEGKYSMTIKMDGNAGIQGIIASSIGEKYGLPTIAMTDLKDGFLAGSGRGIVSTIDLRQAFQDMSEQKPDLFKSMGGHKGAVGCMIPVEFFDDFSELFEQTIQQQIGNSSPKLTLETDGELADWQLETSLINELNQLEPYGREWEKPLFSGNFFVEKIKTVGKDKNHLSLQLYLENSSKSLNAIYFNCVQNGQVPFNVNDEIQCAYQPSLNTYFGKTSLQLKIQTAKKL
jgi:single-stranded-DNA-specific exonuclease